MMREGIHSGTYKAERNGEIFIGTVRQICAYTGYSVNTVRNYLMSTRGKKTRKGWSFSVLEPVSYDLKNRPEYVAERDGDEPVIGSITEIADIIDHHVETIRLALKNHRQLTDGWRFRRYEGGKGE